MGRFLRGGGAFLGIIHSSQQWGTWLMSRQSAQESLELGRFIQRSLGVSVLGSSHTEVGGSIHISFHRNCLKHFKLLSSLFVHIQSNFHSVRISQNQKRSERVWRCHFCAEQHQALLSHLHTPSSSWSSSEWFTSSFPQTQWCSPRSSQPEEKIKSE